ERGDAQAGAALIGVSCSCQRPVPAGPLPRIVRRIAPKRRQEVYAMVNSRVTGVRSIELGVRGLPQSAGFYPTTWPLEEVGADGDSMRFRATGGEHHVLTIRERPKPALLGVHFAATDRAAVDALCAKAKGYGVKVEGELAPLSAAAGGGYGFRFRT